MTRPPRRRPTPSTPPVTATTGVATLVTAAVTAAAVMATVALLSTRAVADDALPAVIAQTLAAHRIPTAAVSLEMREMAGDATRSAVIRSYNQPPLQ